MAGTESKSAVTLKGSADIICEFFNFGINSILYQRGIFPPETFTRVQKYGLTLLVSTNDEIIKYLSVITEQVKGWLLRKSIQKLVLVISTIDTNEVIERWNFNIEYEKDNEIGESKKPKSVSDINKEIGAVIRQITASVTFLPLLDCICSFDLHIYTNKDLEITDEWNDAPPSYIANSQEVRLRSFSTSVHKVDTSVSYKSA